VPEPGNDPSVPSLPDPNGEQPAPRPIIDTTKSDASRFLEQSTFGPTSTEVARVMSLGVDAYLDEQFAKPRTGYMGFKRTAYSPASDCINLQNAPTSSSSLCSRDNYTLFEIQRQFFANAMNGEDQLRQRMAFALSQIFVVSGTEVKQAYVMSTYQNLLLDDAFGNFRDLIEHVTVHPAMGMYLDMLNNDKANVQTGAKPNENYAREFLQLFTIGTAQLNADGTVQTDAEGDPLPTFSQEDVQALARVFTGWTYSVWPGQTSRWVNPPKLYGTLAPIESHHDTDSKTVLGTTMSAGQNAQADLDQALDIIFAHPNVGPFIATRLIQHFVTSNPSAGYVARVASAFNDNGAGVRGDLRAVVRAILLDSEARGSSKSDSNYGKLKEPALFMTGFLRALGGKSDGVFLRSQSAAMGQDIFTAPSVFNYYSPLQRVGDGSLLAPEFGIHNGVSALARIDFVYQLVYANGAAAEPTVINSIGTSLSFDDAASVFAEAQVGSEFDSRMMFGKLSDASYKTVSTALAAFAPEDIQGRARAAAYVLGVSAQYQVQR
jgi:uncharacterized protein (DUF1800 family)